MELIYFLLGVVAGVATSWVFARKSGEELRAETAKLRKLHSLTLRLLAKDLKARLKEDEQGEITGIIEELKGTANFSFAGTAHSTPSQETAGFSQSRSTAHAGAVADPPDSKPS